MSQVGRNDPCPCGSGHKFKKCCLNKSGAVSQAYLSAERASALAKLMRFAARSQFKEIHGAALGLFWGDWLSEEPGHQLEKVMASEQVEIACNSWFAFDFDCGGGQRMLDIYLESEGRQLKSGEFNYLEGMRGSHLRLYEILEVKPDQGFELRDLWDDRRLYVRERAATRQIVAWDLVIGRIGPGGDGETVFETLPYVFPASAKDELLKGSRKAHRLFTREYPQKGIVDFFKTMAPVFHKLWLERVALPPRPKLLTGDGEPFIFAKAIFDLLDRRTVKQALGRHADVVDHGDGSYAWLEDRELFQRSLGTFVVETGRVVLETTSQRRAERGREFLENLAGEAVRFKVISYEDVGQALKSPANPARKDGVEVPSEGQAEALGRFYEEHYRTWLDEPVPALGNRTPRHAARLKTIRPKLIALLKDFESHSERQRRSGTIAYDFSWMWDELGISRQ